MQNPSYLSSLLLFLFSIFLNHCSFCYGNQGENLLRLLKSRKSHNPPVSKSWIDIGLQVYSPTANVMPEDGLMEADKILKLPGQPSNVDFDQYSGYVTVDKHVGKSLFYYFVESPETPSTKPLLLWLNGGPGCSSLYGAMQELGPFGVKNDGKTLYRNNYAWNNVANILFLESPVGVGFSYSNTTSDYDHHQGDKQTAKDSYVFLVNWLERFPSYKNRDFYIAGESYAGHYVPQLASTILHNNKNENKAIINLKGIAIGNALIDSPTLDKGNYDFFWTHALISDETYNGISCHCNNINNQKKPSNECISYEMKANDESGSIYIYNIYAPAFCQHPLLKNGSISSEKTYGRCQDTYLEAYLNLGEVQTALHAKRTKWSACSSFPWNDSPDTILPIIQKLFSNNISVWIYSGDVDGIIPITSTRYAINSLKLPIEIPWRPWYIKEDDEVGGYVERYKGVTFVTVRGSGHMVPIDQPQRALTMISAFLQGTLPPSS